jgi:hypothetical protein
MLVVAWCVETALPLFARNARDELFAAKEARGEHVDRRNRHEVLAALRAEGRDAVAALVPARLLAPATDDALRSRIAIAGREVLPFSGPAHSTTVMCNELGEWAIYESDRHGFRNDDALWEAQPEVVLAGDSFTIGRCVRDEHTIAANLKRTHTTLNLGMGGTGPLAQLGVLAEYAPLVRPRRTLWIHFANDLDAADLGTERNSPLLMRYLEPGFTQGLAEARSSLDLETRRLLMEEEALTRTPPAQPTLARRLPEILALRGLRERARSIVASQRDGVSQESIALYTRIVARGRDLVASWGGELLLAYLHRDASVARGAPPDSHARAVLEVAYETRVAALDLGPALRAQPDPVGLYAYPGGTAAGPAHLNERGYAVVAEALREFLSHH